MTTPVDAHFEKSQGNARVHVRTESEEPNRLVHPAQQPGGFDRSDAGEVDVEHHHLRTRLFHQVNRFLSIDRFTDDVNVSS